MSRIRNTGIMDGRGCVILVSGLISNLFSQQRGEEDGRQEQRGAGWGGGG
jgi:hypothetical protein